MGFFYLNLIIVSQWAKFYGIVTVNTYYICYKQNTPSVNYNFLRSPLHALSFVPSLIIFSCISCGFAFRMQDTDSLLYIQHFQWDSRWRKSGAGAALMKLNFTNHSKITLREPLHGLFSTAFNNISKLAEKESLITRWGLERFRSDYCTSCQV